MTVLERQEQAARKLTAKMTACAVTSVLAADLRSKMADAGAKLAGSFPEELRPAVLAALQVQAAVVGEACEGWAKRWHDETLVLRGRLEEMEDTAAGAEEGSEASP